MSEYELPRCDKKKLSKIAAQIAMTKISRSDSRNRREKRFYHCPLCGWWHLTSNGRFSGKRPKKERVMPNKKKEIMRDLRDEEDKENQI